MALTPYVVGAEYLHADCVLGGVTTHAGEGVLCTQRITCFLYSDTCSGVQRCI